MEDQVVAVLLDAQTFNALSQYLASRPFAEVAGFFEQFNKLPGINQAQIDTLNVEEEKSPE